MFTPFLPSPGQQNLEDKALEFTQLASHLSGKLSEATQQSLGELVRTMNCYYSNLIEGHQTLPRDIEAALQERYSSEPKTRTLQQEAVAHIAVQRLIDSGNDPSDPPTSAHYIKWIHREFCERLPPELLKVTNSDTGETIDVVPGEFRTADVAVGRHIPPKHQFVDESIRLFEDAYRPRKLMGLNRLISIASAHHRILWIHPFVDGNGRVARLMSHAMFLKGGFGSPIWSISRGLARSVETYKRKLELADYPRQGDLDGRGSLSHSALLEFCEFFLDTCIDQINFMGSLVQPSELERRIRLYTKDEVDAGRLYKGAEDVLVAVLYQGSIERGKVAAITGYKERRARQVLSQLIQKELLVPEGPKKPVRLGFPVTVVERWLPALFH